MNFFKFFWSGVVLAVLVIFIAVSCTPSASADEGVPQPVPVEEVQEQLPEEIIGRQIECPDGSVGRIISVVGNTDCAVPGPRIDPPAVRTPEPTQEPTPAPRPEPTATPTPNPTAEPSQPSEEPSASPTTEPSTTATPTPLPECTDPMVECACDHFIGGCTGGNPPDGEGTPFPQPTPEPTDEPFAGVNTEASVSNAQESSATDLVLIGVGICALLALALLAFRRIYK